MKLEDLDIGETSGVDHPAHLSEGWLLMKAAGKGGRMTQADSSAPPIERLRRLHGVIGEVLKQADGGDNMTTENSTVPEAVAAFLDTASPDEDVRKAIEGAFVPSEPASTETDEDAFLKAADPAVREAIVKERERSDRLEKALNTEVERRETEDAVAKARDWANVGLDANEFGPTLRKLRTLDADVAAEVEKVLDGAQAVAGASAVFSTIGKSTSGNGGDTIAQIEAMAKDRMSKSTDGLSYAAAYDAVLQSEEGQRLYDQAQREKQEVTR